MAIRPQSRTALITGAALRVGRAIALSLAGAGWDIALHYNASAKPAEALASQLRGKGRKVTLVKADLRDADAVAHIIPSLARKGVKLGCLINNASVFEKDSLATLEREHWHAQMDVNLFAPLILMRDFAAQYKGRDGSIVNITDGLYGWSMSPAFLSYSLSKQGLAFATRMLAQEFAPRVRVNAIAAGVMPQSGDDTRETFAKIKKMIPLKRASSSREMCDAIHYLLSAPSLTGQVISLAGGISHV